MGHQPSRPRPPVIAVDDGAEPPGYATLPALWPAEIAAVSRATAPPG